MTILVKDTAGMTDGKLLESFIARKDEASFEARVVTAARWSSVCAAAAKWPPTWPSTFS
jgi:hypothetical protein